MPPIIKPGEFLGEHATEPSTALEVEQHRPRRPHDAVAGGAQLQAEVDIVVVERQLRGEAADLVEGSPVDQRTRRGDCAALALDSERTQWPRARGVAAPPETGVIGL